MNEEEEEEEENEATATTHRSSNILEHEEDVVFSIVRVVVDISFLFCASDVMEREKETFWLF